MKKLFFIMFIALLTSQSLAQSQNLFGIVRKNYVTTVVDSINGMYERFDSCTVRLGSLNPATGQVVNMGNNAYTRSVNLTGAALNPYDSTFIFIGGTDMLALSLVNGQIVTNTPVSNPAGSGSFDNFRFNNADSTLYGLTRRVTYDSITAETTTEMFLSKINTATGAITQISPQSIGSGYALAGSTIDPYQMVFYYSTGSNIVGLDLYNGSIYSNVPIQNSFGAVFDNFAYSCVDTAIYGLIRQSYFSVVEDTLIPGLQYEVFDSSTIKLGKINPTTGIVTLISPGTVTQGGYSLSSGAAVDPNTMTYYYNNGSNIIGVSLITGLQTSNQPLTFEDGQYIELMRSYANCYDSYVKRLPTITTIPNGTAVNTDLKIFPNPANSCLHFNSNSTINSIEIISVEGKIIFTENSKNTTAVIDINNLAPGLYFARAITANNVVKTLKFIKE